MIVIAFIMGLLLPALNGWLLLRLLERHTVMLARVERWILGLVLGLTGTMFLTFCLHVATELPFSLMVMMGLQLVLIALQAGLMKSLGVPFGRTDSIELAPAGQLPTGWKRWGIWLLALWTVGHIAYIIGVFTMTPTFLDDSLDNWNLRGKVFYEDQRLTLELPGEDPGQSIQGVSSYPMGVPLAKAWLANIAGRWSDPLINSLHPVWYLSAIGLLYFLLRRRLNRGWSLVGLYLLASMPLYLMHGTNPYGDVFLSAHVLPAIGYLFYALREQDALKSLHYLKISALAAGLLLFTKNEALLLYLPPLLLILVLGLAYRYKQNTISMQQLMRWLVYVAIAIVVVLLPWLLFKWMNGLTFGNAKPISKLGVGWQQGVLYAVAVNTFFEGNWLLLFAFFFGLIIWRYKAAFGPFIALSAYVLIIYFGQMSLYMFTSISNEALMQTGYARGLVQLMPVIVLLTTFLLQEGISVLTSKRMQEEEY